MNPDLYYLLVLISVHLIYFVVFLGILLWLHRRYIKNIQNKQEITFKNCIHTGQIMLIFIPILLLDIFICIFIVGLLCGDAGCPSDFLPLTMLKILTIIIPILSIVSVILQLYGTIRLKFKKISFWTYIFIFLPISVSLYLLFNII